MPKRRRTIAASGAEQRVDLGGGPDVERAFALDSCGFAVARRRSSRVGVLGRIERAVGRRQVAQRRRRACPRRPRRRTLRRSSARPRGTRARAAPGRRASSRSAARATRRRPSSDGIRRRRDRACRRAPSRAASRAPSARARSSAGQRAGVRAGTAARTGAGTSARRRSRRGARSNALRERGDRPRRPRRGRRRARGPARASSAPVDSPQPLDDVVGRVDEPRRARRATPARARASTSTNPGRPQRDVGGKYVPPKNGLQIRREPHAHRPAARAGRRLHERHVDAIDVRPLFAIDLDRDEVAVEHVRRRRRPRTTRAP